MRELRLTESCGCGSSLPYGDCCANNAEMLYLADGTDTIPCRRIATVNALPSSETAGYALEVPFQPLPNAVYLIDEHGSIFEPDVVLEKSAFDPAETCRFTYKDGQISESEPEAEEPEPPPPPTPDPFIGIGHFDIVDLIINVRRRL
jgi:hypothetical protein